MRFIHLSDVGLGKNTESGKFWGRDRAVEIMGTLRKTVDKAASSACELLIISGGLFSHQPVTSELEEINRLFLSIPSVEVVIVAGESDIIRKNSPVNSFLWAPNVHYVLSGSVERIEFKRFNAVIYAKSASDNGTDEFDRLMEAALSEKQTTVCMAVASEPDIEKVKGFFEGADIREHMKGISYAALGGVEKHQEIVMSKVYYSGGLEPKEMQDTGEHGAYIGDISNATGQLIKLDFIPMAETSYIYLNIEVDEATTGAELLSRIRLLMDKRGKKNIYRLHVFGKKNPDEVFQLERLEKEYRIAEIIDESEPQYDFSALFQEHPQDMIGYYISKLIKNEEEMSEIEHKAMYYGINALLKTAEQKGKE